MRKYYFTFLTLGLHMALQSLNCSAQSILNADGKAISEASVLSSNGTETTAPASKESNRTEQVDGLCGPVSVCPQTSSFTDWVRGYYFISPVAFKICGLYIPTDASFGAQSIEVVRFLDSLPPTYPKLTNRFTSLFYVANDKSNAMIPCDISINAGDSIGVYGVRDSVVNFNSYGHSHCVISLLGDTTTLNRSGMQFPLSNQQMHDVWSENAGEIGRIIMYLDSPVTVQDINVDPSMINVYPNPSHGIFSVTSKTRISEIEIVNMLGEKIYSQQVNAENAIIDLKRQSPGIYFYQIKTEAGLLKTGKIFIE